MANVFSSTITLRIENKMLDWEQDKIDCRRIPNGNIEKSFHRFFSQTLESLFTQDKIQHANVVVF